MVLCPTRELCIQIAKDVESYTKYIKNPGITSIYGGAAYGPQIKDLKAGSKFVIATPRQACRSNKQGKAKFPCFKISNT